MILKQKWPQNHQKNTEKGYNPRRKNTFILTDEHMNTGKPYIEAKFEAEIAPLITIGRTKFEVIPYDGDPNNTELKNILLSGPGKTKGLKRENAVKNEILRLEYDPEYDDFSYIYKENGVYSELRYKKFESLRNRVAQSRHLHGLKNKKYLLTIAEYTQLYDDYIHQLTPEDDTKFDICSYKTEQIVWFWTNCLSKDEQIREKFSSKTTKRTQITWTTRPQGHQRSLKDGRDAQTTRPRPEDTDTGYGRDIHEKFYQK